MLQNISHSISIPMKNNQKKSEKASTHLSLDDIPLSSSLGHLAYGDIAFKLWREKKKINKSQSHE